MEKIFFSNKNLDALFDKLATKISFRDDPSIKQKYKTILGEKMRTIYNSFAKDIPDNEKNKDLFIELNKRSLNTIINDIVEIKKKKF